MKYGVLQFSYSHFQQFEKRLTETGLYSINLGDDMQTLAVRHRFSWLQEGLPLHVSPNFDTVDWSFPNRQIDHIRQAQSEALSRGIDAALNRAKAFGLT